MEPGAWGTERLTPEAQGGRTQCPSGTPAAHAPAGAWLCLAAPLRAPEQESKRLFHTHGVF